MTNPELSAFKSKLIGLFPRAELTQEELTLFLRKIARVPFNAAVAALEDHKLEQDTRNKKRPIAQAILKAVAASTSRSKEQAPTLSFADAIRSQRPEMSERSDFEVLLRHARAEWHIYLSRSGHRRQSIEAAIQHRGLTGHAAAVLTRAHDRQVIAFRRKVRTSCRGTLVGAGMEPAAARRYAVAAVRSDVETFRLVLEDVQMYGAAVAAAAA